MVDIDDLFDSEEPEQRPFDPVEEELFVEEDVSDTDSFDDMLGKFSAEVESPKRSAERTVASSTEEGRSRTLTEEKTPKEPKAKPKPKTVIDFTASGQLRVPKGYADVREAIRGGMSAKDAADQFDKDVAVCEEIAAKLKDAPAKPKKEKKAEAE